MTSKITIIAALLWAAPARADIASEVAAIKADTLAETKLAAEKQTSMQANASLAKEEKIYTDQIQNRLGPRAAIEADAGQLREKFAKLGESIAKWNGNCGGERERPVYERCLGERRYLERKQTSLDGERDRLVERGTAYDHQLAPYTKRLTEIAAQTTKNAAAIADAERGIAAVRARIAQAKAKLVEACKAAATPEDVKYCGDLGWSNAKPGLPRLEDVLKAR